MNNMFYNEEAKLLYERIITLNKNLMLDEESISLKKHIVINNGSLINTCNLVYGYKPFTEPPEPYCEDFAEMTARLIFHLNKGHCFADGNKRTTLLIIMELIKDAYPVFYNEFFRGSLANFLVEMLSESLEYKNILEWVYKQYDLRYDISNEEQSLLEIAVNYKKAGLYDKAKEIYTSLLHKYGSSSILYNGIAKVLACNGEYEEAIKMFESAIEIAENNNIYDFQSIYHKKMLEERKSIPKTEFFKYMKSVSENDNFQLK
ncbi:Fic family protein [Fusobacterium sp.]|uniref:Fic family protein n=1 Tax=Fusobacterium sp. TaxID=68766 RepID=UPI00262A5F44|nr:Fic family protein [Fusobacterium sp.]